MIVSFAFTRYYHGYYFITRIAYICIRLKYLPRVRSGYSMCRQMSWRCCLTWPRRAPMRSCSQYSAVAECRSKTLLTEGSVDFQGCAQAEQHDGRERAQRHQQAAPHAVPCKVRQKRHLRTHAHEDKSGYRPCRAPDLCSQHILSSCVYVRTGHIRCCSALGTIRSNSENGAAACSKKVLKNTNKP